MIEVILILVLLAILVWLFLSGKVGSFLGEIFISGQADVSEPNPETEIISKATLVKELTIKPLVPTSRDEDKLFHSGIITEITAKEPTSLSTETAPNAFQKTETSPYLMEKIVKVQSRIV